MNDHLTDDLEASHLILNYLNAGYQGQFTYHNILSQLKFVSFSLENVSKTREVLNQVNMWLESLWINIPIVKASWTTPEDYKSRRALELLEELREGLREQATTVFKIFGRKDLTPEAESVKVLIASFGRYAYARENYVRGFIEYAKVFAQPEIKATYEELLKDSEIELNMTHQLIKLFQKNQKLSDTEFEQLLDLTLTLPGTFCTQIHDINQVIAPLKGGFSFKLAEIGEKEEKKWREAQIEAVDAGYWRAFGIKPEEVGVWIENGFKEALQVARWKLWGFAPAEAKPWFEAGLPENMAAVWYKAGYSAEKAIEHIEKGVVHPSEVAPDQIKDEQD